MKNFTCRQLILTKYGVCNTQKDIKDEEWNYKQSFFYRAIETVLGDCLDVRNERGASYDAYAD